MVDTAFSYGVPVFSDADNDSLTYSATGLPAGLSFNTSSRVLSGTPTTAGAYTVTITANDGSGGSVSRSFTVTVSAVPVPNPNWLGTAQSLYENTYRYASYYNLQLPPGYDQPLSLLAYNIDLRDALYPHVVAEQATATQKVLGAVGGAVLAAGDFGRETVDSTVSLARNFVAAGMYQWGIADRLGVREQSGIYADQLGESVAALVGLASAEGVGKVWNHFSGQYSQAATLWKRGDADSIVAASRVATKASLEVGSIATGTYGAIKLTVSGLRMAGTFAQGARAMLATMEGAAYGESPRVQ